jgi:hypothetical protein
LLAGTAPTVAAPGPVQLSLHVTVNLAPRRTH